jgi:glycolate oxidase iron-sulfur subunit
MYAMMLTTQEIIAEADRCVACGLCLPHCPTYHKTGSEADSPRGRIQLMSAVAREILPANARFKQHIDLCLSCRNCESACPNGVKYGALIDTARATVAKKPSFSDKVANHFIQHPAQMRLAGSTLRYSQTLGLTRLAAKLSSKLKKPIALLPNLAKPQTWREIYPTQHTKQGEVSLFLGCISNTFDTQTLLSSVFVLNRLGFDVHIPSAQACCGGLARQQGNAKLAADYIAANNGAFDKNRVVISVASGCGAGLQDYSNLKIEDISAFLMACNWHGVQLQALNNEIVVHEPCTLRNVQKTHSAVTELLKKIPNAKISNLAGNAQCCGGAGAYMLTQTDMANSLLNDKVTAVQKTSATILATSNIGCALHIAAGLRAQNMAIHVLHPVSIIAKQLGMTGDLI